jgi:hypothetical protein
MEVSVGRIYGRGPVGKCRSWGRDIVKMDLNEVGCVNLNWLRAQWQAPVNSAMDRRVPMKN